jgi:hypothetical protein
MSWPGYFTLDDAEFINAARFEAYAANASWFHPAYARADLDWLLEEAYTDPATDLAPWYDDDVPVSADFYGFYPGSVDGLDNSTRSAAGSESTRDGGVPGRVRHASKGVVFAGILAGRSDQAVEYGLEWLRLTLLGALCGPRDVRKQGLGAELRYLGYEPHESPSEAPQAVLKAATRRLQKAAVTGPGPTVLATRTTGCGDVIWQVQFTLTAGDPTVYGDDQWIVSEIDVVGETATWDPAVTAGTVSETRVYLEDPCNLPTYSPLYDPECASVITPPIPPNVPFGCWVPPEIDDEWTRATITVPEQNFPTWREMLPTLVLTSDVDVVRDLRIRFYRDPEDDLDPDADPCAPISDMVVSYLPAASEMIISGLFEEVYVTTPNGHRRRADSLVFATAMKPIDWPVLACGVQHLITVETRTGDWPEINLYLTPRAV